MFPPNGLPGRRRGMFSRLTLRHRAKENTTHGNRHCFSSATDVHSALPSPTIRRPNDDVALNVNRQRVGRPPSTRKKPFQSDREMYVRCCQDEKSENNLRSVSAHHVGP